MPTRDEVRKEMGIPAVVESTRMAPWNVNNLGFDSTLANIGVAETARMNAMRPDSANHAYKEGPRCFGAGSFMPRRVLDRVSRGIIWINSAGLNIMTFACSPQVRPSCVGSLAR